MDGQREEFKHFLEAIARSETQTVSSRIWTEIVDSIFFDDNSYT